MQIKSVRPSPANFGVDISLNPAEAFNLQVILGEVNRYAIPEYVALLDVLEDRLRQARVNGINYDSEQ